MIILLAPVFAWLWVWLGTRDPSSPTKFAVGLLFVGLGFVVMIGAAQATAGGALVSPLWLAVTYLLHTIGELCLSPVGLSSMTRLAPDRVKGMMMGVWFLAASVGNLIAGRVAGLYESFTLTQLFTRGDGVRAGGEPGDVRAGGADPEDAGEGLGQLCPSQVQLPGLARGVSLQALGFVVRTLLATGEVRTRPPGHPRASPSPDTLCELP